MKEINMLNKFKSTSILLIGALISIQTYASDLNDIIKKAYSKLILRLAEQNIRFNEDDFIFTSQKGSVYKTQSINDILKTIFNSNKLQISSHSLRKSFARRVYQNHNESENALVLLSDIFSHSSIAITRRYLGIRQETISNVYLSL